MDEPAQLLVGINEVLLHLIESALQIGGFREEMQEPEGAEQREIFIMQHVNYK